MKYTKFLLLLLVFVSVFAAFVFADGKNPKIDSMLLLSDGVDPIYEIRGGHFGQDINAVQVMINDNGLFARVIKVRPQKVTVQLPTAKLCSGIITLRVLVNRVPSNPGELYFNLGTPTIESVSPQHAKAGDLIEIRGNNLSCNLVNNLVSINDSPVSVLSLNNGALSVRVPENISAGLSQLRILTAGQSSAPLPFTVDATDLGNHDTPTPDPNLQFVSSNSERGSAGFSPMFNINDTNSLMDSLSNPDGYFWDATFAGSHQAIIKMPWKTVNGQQQVALLTINCGHSNSLVGNNTNQFEKFIYMRINYPLHPDQPYDAVENTFWWGASAICTEHMPRGGIYFNSLGQAHGGVDSFVVPRTLPGQARLSLTMTVVAPDILGYEEYGTNYAKAGNGHVFLPKVATISVDLDAMDTRMPAVKYNFGNVTITDESAGNGSFTTTNAKFQSDVVMVGNQPQL